MWSSIKFFIGCMAFIIMMICAYGAWRAGEYKDLMYFWLVAGIILCL